MLKTIGGRIGLARRGLILGVALASPVAAQEEPAEAAPSTEEAAVEENEGAADSDDAGEEQSESTTESESAADDSSETEDTSSAEEQEPEAKEEVAPEEAPVEESEPPPPKYEEQAEASVALESKESDDVLLFPEVKPPTPFDKGRITLGVSLGMASSFNEDWLILGLGVGYYVVKGLETHVDTTFWLIGDPFMATITPGVRYVLHFVPKVKPYVGGFYRHYFVGGGYDDTNSIGARMGLNFMTGKMSYFGAGAVYEHFLDDELFSDQDQWYPEIVFAFTF